MNQKLFYCQKFMGDLFVCGIILFERILTVVEEGTQIFFLG